MRITDGNKPKHQLAQNGFELFFLNKNKENSHQSQFQFPKLIVCKYISINKLYFNCNELVLQIMLTTF